MTARQIFDELKQRRGDAILLVRVADHYEAFYRDASTIAPLLGLTINSTPCGRFATVSFPFHHLEAYLARLIALGKRVCVCDRIVEKERGRYVGRNVERVVLPGSLVS